MKYIDLEAEFNLLGHLMAIPQQMASYLDLPTEVFTSEITQDAFVILRDAFMNGNKLTISTITPRLKGDKEQNSQTLKTMMRSALNFDAGISADSLRTLYKKRKLAEKLELATVSLEEKATADDAVQDILDFMSELESGKDRLRVKGVDEIFNTVTNMLDNPLPTLKSGLGELDRVLRGGFIKGKSYSISARKKVGKTALLGQLAVNLANMGQRVLYIALEMGSEQIMHRMLARSMQINPVDFLNEEGQKAGFKDNYQRAAQVFPKTLRFIDGAGMSFDELKALLVKESRRIDCFVLDYWQLVGGKQKNKSTSEHLDDIAQWLSDYARRNNLLNITATQINQEGNTRGSEGIRLAYDMTMIVHVNEDAPRPDLIGLGRWIEMTDTRYTPFQDAGDENTPAIYLNPQGVFFYDR